MKKALVGESNYSEFEILNEFLTSRGFEVQWVKTGPDAIGAFTAHQPDLMILDALIPGLTGLKVCQHIRKLPGGDRVKTILLSKVYHQFRRQYESRQAVGVDAYSGKPVNVSDLEKVVVELTGERLVAPEPAAEPERRGFGSTGTLGETPFPRLLFYLRKYRRTGALRVSHEQISKVIYFRDGSPIFVTSNLSNESLGRYMVQRGLINDEQYNSSLERMLATGKQHGAVLLEMGVISPHQLYEALQGQGAEKILRVFAWDEGEYEFRPGSFSLDQTVLLDVPALRLLFDGIKRFYNLSRLERYFNEYKQHRIVRVKNSLYTRGLLAVAPQEASFLKLVDGKRTAGKLVSLSHLNLTETFQLLYYFILTETIRFVDDPEFATRGIQRQEEFLADRRRRATDVHQIHERRGSDLDKQMRDFRRLILRKHESLGRLNHYELLNITADADDDQIRVAYHRLARRYRPYELTGRAERDLRAKAEAIFDALTAAYETLLDANARRAYDETLHGTRRVAQEPPREAVRREPPAPPPVVESAAPLDEADEFEFATAEPAAERAAERAAEPAGDLDFDDISDLLEAEPIDVDSSRNALDLEWEIEKELSAGEGRDGDLELDDFFADKGDDARLAEAGEVTADVANLVRSELAFQRGEDCMRRKEYAAACVHFAEAGHLNPKEAEYHGYLGWATFLRDPHDAANVVAARDQLERAVSINPVLDSAYAFLGMVELHQGNRDRARAYFEQALQYNPDNTRALHELGKLGEE